MQKAALVSLLGILTQAGCATATHPIIARSLAPEEVGKVKRDVHVVLQDGATYDLKAALVKHDSLQGTTADGQRVTLPASDIRDAWRMESPRDAHLVVLGPLAVIGATSLPALVILGLMALSSP